MVYLKKRHFSRKFKIGLLIILVFCILFLIDYWQIRKGEVPYLRRWFPPYDYTFQSHQIDMAIESSLVSLGLTSEDIIKTYREEKEIGRKKWIYVYKEIKVPLDADLNHYAAVIELEVKKEGGKVFFRQLPKKEEKTFKLILGVKDIPTATLILKAQPKAKIAIIIDDVGNGGPLADKLLELPFPATLSIIPNLDHSTDIAERAHQLGYEVMLHLPMESIKSEENRGKGIIYVGMNEKDIIRLVEESLDSIPYAVGVNNHMGSRVCQDPEVLEIIFSQLKKHHLYFIDSLVIANSLAFDVAQKMSIPSHYRRVFLDNQSNPDYIKAQLEELKEKAISEGEAIGIGHCRRNTLDVLAKAVPEMEKEGIKFVFASELTR